MMSPTRLILVGGFLGAGKTTLLRQAAERLAGAGRRVGLITNDQASDLADTGLLQDAGFAVREIAGGCFCCRFGDLVAASRELVRSLHPDVIIAEPVGSCTDLSATVVQPLKDLFAAELAPAPFSVLVDPFRLAEALDPRQPSPLHASARYILRKQLEEADILVLNKVDLLSPEDLEELRAELKERFPGTPIYEISALTGAGVDAWLRAVLSSSLAGQRIAEVDYDTYAEGEAVLGWLNATVRLTTAGNTDWRAFAERLLTAFQAAMGEREIAHAKLLLSTAAGQISGSLTRPAGTPAVRGEIAGNPRAAALTFNARVEMVPEKLQSLVANLLSEIAGPVTVTIEKMNCLSPGRPRPTHRYQTVV